MADDTRALVASVTGFPAPTGPLDLALHAGDVLHLRGGNGTGKTSLLRALAGLDAPMQPRVVTVGGGDPRTLPAPELARRVRAVWAVPRAGLVGLTVQGEARLRGHLLPDTLDALRDRDVATLSSGEARRVALHMAHASPAPLLLLDEPADGLDAQGLALLDALVADARGRGAVVVADHTGWAARHATRTVDLGAPGASDPFEVPAAPRTGPRLLAAAATVRRDAHAVPLPGIDVGPGLHAVTGRNGAGKSTLLRRLAGLASSKGVTLDGAAPRAGHDTRLLLTDAGDLARAQTVREDLAGAPDPAGLVAPALSDRHPLSLSAGEAQRVALAKVLGRDAPVHLLDEPETHLDADGRARLAAAIALRIAQGGCVVVATHDPALLAAAHTRIEVGP